MIRKITLINVNGRFRLQGQTLSKEDLILLFNLHGYVIEENLDCLKFYTVALRVLSEIPEDLLTHSLEHVSGLFPEEKVYYSSMARQKAVILDSLGKN